MEFHSVEEDPTQVWGCLECLLYVLNSNDPTLFPTLTVIQDAQIAELCNSSGMECTKVKYVLNLGFRLYYIYFTEYTTQQHWNA